MEEIVIKIEALDSDVEDEDISFTGDTGADEGVGADGSMQGVSRPTIGVEHSEDIGQAAPFSNFHTSRKETHNFVQPEVQLMSTDDVRDNLNKALAVINQAMDIPLDVQPKEPVNEVQLDVEPGDTVVPSLTVIKHIEGVASSSVCDSIFRNLNRASIEIGKTFVEASRPGNYSDRSFCTGPYRGPYRCEQCGEVFTVWRTFMTHTKTHLAPHKCTVCGKVFSSKLELQDHQRLHPVSSEPSANNGEVCHKCSVCGEVFDLRRKLRRHAVQHVGEKPFRCEICNLAFEKPHQLRSHRKVHSGGKKHQCSHCGHRFKTPGELTEHRRVHTGEKPYQCEYCPGEFARQASLKRHLKAHTASRAHKCRFCGKSYSEAYHLKDHERVHTGELPYPCRHCSDSFRLLCQLKRHTLLEHPWDLQASLIGAQSGGRVMDSEPEGFTVAGTVDQDVQSTVSVVKTE